MWHDMFVVQIPVLEKILRTVLVYAMIVLLFRATGRRSLAQLNTLDFAVLFLLSNVVQNAVIGSDVSFTGGAIGAVTLVAVDNVLDRLIARYEWAARILEGGPTTVIRDGKLVTSEVRRLSLRVREIERAVRTQRGDDISEVAEAVLEPGGHLLVTLRREEQSATKGDIEAVLARLASIEERLAVGRPETR